MNIIITHCLKQVTAAESLLSNGLIERRNLIIADIFGDDCFCDMVNQKRCLALF